MSCQANNTDLLEYTNHIKIFTRLGVIFNKRDRFDNHRVPHSLLLWTEEYRLRTRGSSSIEKLRIRCFFCDCCLSHTIAAHGESRRRCWQHLDNRSVPELTGAAVYRTAGCISDLTVEGIITAPPLDTICQGFFSHHAQKYFHNKQCLSVSRLF